MRSIVVLSGYFNPLHVGHIRLLEAASRLGDRVVVIVNNDQQQLLKKGKIIMDELERLEIVQAIKSVDEVVLSIDKDRSIARTLEQLAQSNPKSRIIFANGGDRQSAAVVPETPICERFGIEMRFDVGGTEKLNSSSNINRRRGEE